jgi:hypothetical protein
MDATPVMPATTVMPATSKDDSSIMTTHNSRKASNSRNESNIRTGTKWMPATAGMLVKVVKPATACRKANYSSDTFKIRDDSNSSRTARIESRKISNSKEDINTQQGHMQHRSRISQLED